jgi:microcystin-dependent protein
MIITRMKLTAALATLALLALFLVPPPQQSRAQFSGQGTYGGTSGGSANAQTITIPNLPSNLVGIPLSFTVGFTNTGPATLSVSAIGAVAIQRPSSIGPVALSGAELTVGELVSVTYTGTVYLITSNVDTTPIGKTVEFRGASTPRGSLIEDGSCVLRSTYAPLFSVIGTTYGACDGSTTFAVPDSRGTTFAALDNQGANGAANRITSAGSGCTATAVGLCGSQNQTLTLAQLPTGITASNATQTINVQTSNAAMMFGGTPTTFTSGGPFTTYGNISEGAVISTGSNNISVTSNNTSGSAHPILGPISLGRRAIKY